MQFTFSSSGLVQSSIAIGAGVGGLVVGLLFGLVAAFLLIRRYYKKKMQTDLASLHGSPRDFRYRSIPTSGISHRNLTPETSSGGFHRLRPGSLQYHVEPFVMPDENGNLVADETSPEPVPFSAAPQQQSHVYVLHHDSNIPPVTIFHEGGTEIVELPPRYLRSTPQSDMLSEGRTRSDSRSDGSRAGNSQPLTIHEPRQLAHLGKSAR
jgi:hypothetical protein